MTDILTLATAFGLAAGAGARAAVPVLALGIFHHSPWFELSSEFSWIAHPPVMLLLGFILLFEAWADANPEMGELSDLAAYVPKMLAGFLAFAAVTGRVDGSLLELLGSGILGGTTATGVHWMRNQLRRPFRHSAELAHGGFGRIATLSETGVSATLSSAAIMTPFAALGLVGVFGLSALYARRLVGSGREPCGACGHLRKTGALVCSGCGVEVSV